MILLSTALQRGAKVAPAADIFACIWVGADPRDHRAAEVLTLPPPTILFKSLSRSFPRLNQTVRSWPRLATELEKISPIMLPRVQEYSAVYRRQIHMSLWAVIAELTEREWSKDRIAGLLERYGL